MDAALLIPIIVPLIVFASITAIVATPFYFRHRNRRLLYESIKTSVEETGSADPKLIAAITHDSVGPNADLRRGILMLALASALIVLGFFAKWDVPFFGLAAFPGFIGAAYIIFHLFIPREATV
ncbi:MAG: DUF6249 domain-containing protein [Aquisalinus sp.]|nr:DUF6249 domain-containing protein [Aquisalinus sp.]